MCLATEAQSVSGVHAALAGVQVTLHPSCLLIHYMRCLPRLFSAAVYSPAGFGLSRCYLSHAVSDCGLRQPTPRSLRSSGVNFVLVVSYVGAYTRIVARSPSGNVCHRRGPPPDQRFAPSIPCSDFIAICTRFRASWAGVFRHPYPTCPGVVSASASGDLTSAECLRAFRIFVGRCRPVNLLSPQRPVLGILRRCHS